MTIWFIFLSIQALSKPVYVEFTSTQGDETCGETPLHVAVRRRNLSAVSELVRYGADMYEYDCANRTPFHLAILRDEQAILQLFIEFRFDVNARFVGGTTVLHFVASNGSVMSVYTVAKAGAREAVNDEGDTPYFLALKLNRTLVSEALRINGANVFMRFQNGDTYLHKAVRMINVRLTVFFIKHGLGVDNMNVNYETPLCVAVKVDNPIIVNILLAHGARFDQKGSNGETYIHVAVMSKSLQVLRALLEHGSLVDSTDANGETAFAWAIKNDDVKAVKVLIKYRGDLHRKDPLGRTYLHFAVLKGSLKSLRILLSNGLHPDVYDNSGTSPMALAATLNFTGAMETLKSFGSDVFQRFGPESTPLTHVAAARGAAGSILWLLENGLDVNETDSNRRTSLHVAASFQQLDAAKLLVDLGVCINCRSANGQTALYMANLFYVTPVGAFIKSKGGLY